ncbi:MAG: bifunctional fucokinase/fucose-1-phosphate guanylyltransferase [Paludibacter sp.]|nr:bifunctional fucokinase/fucose-1-phosphate guanylyltransferase [Paludibacter sp.]
MKDDCRQRDAVETGDTAEAVVVSASFMEWLGKEKRILLHAGGQSRRLPAYAPSGKILTPIPVFRWERGQQLNQHLLSIQLPLYEKLMAKAPAGLNTLIASGDVYIRSEESLQDIPQADVVCYGLWTDLSLATRHGVFAARRDTPHRLDFMMQKPSLARLEELSSSHFFLMDIGVWILSDRAVEVLMRRSYADGGSFPRYFDLYSDFGPALGDHPSIADDEIHQLTVAVLPLSGGEFYHFGTSRELITSTLAIQNKVYDQRRVLQRKVKPHPAMFVQNAQVGVPLLPSNDTLWIENSWIGPQWQLSREHVITGVPRNDWPLRLPQGMCVDVVPLSREHYVGVNTSDETLTGILEQSLAFVARPYHIDDAFRGDASSAVWMGVPLAQWLDERGIGQDEGSLEFATQLAQQQTSSTESLSDGLRTGTALFAFFSDFQQARIFPCVDTTDELGLVLRWMISEPELAEGRRIWQESAKYSADELSASADLNALYAHRRELFRSNLPVLAANFDRSVFYQTDLTALAREWVDGALPLPPVLPDTATLLHRMHNRMFRARCLSVQAQSPIAMNGSVAPDKSLRDQAFLASSDDRAAAFQLMREALLAEASTHSSCPRLSVLSDQIVWSRSPVRIDLAGGWTDTPPYSLYAGGSVVNIAIDLNGQQPLQVYLKPSATFDIVLRSIDIGASEHITTYEELLQYTAVGSPFSIPRAALTLAGFGNESGFASLRHQLEAFGAGIELTLLAAIPAGSGLGTSSLLASTVLGGLNDFCGLGWDKHEICLRTLALEQLLTTGGGWQDQYGGVLHGVKLLHTEAGLRQSPAVSWLPDFLYTRPGYQNCHLLYYTGITRTAKHILSEIVEGMFLNSAAHLRLLAEMKDHATEMAAAIQTGDFERYASLVSTTWAQNKALDSGTNPPAVEAIIRKVHDFTAGYKLPGAGGGGYLYMVAKDPEAAARIRRQLTDEAPNARARFVDMSLSATGLQVSRS